MKIFKIIIPIILILILILLISGCGGGGDFSPTPPTVDTLEYSQWKARIKAEIGFFGFPKYWNTTLMKLFKFGAYEEYSDLYLTAIILQWPDFPSPSEIYEQKIYNCHRMTILMKDIFGGLYVRFDQKQEQSERRIGHAVLLSQWTVEEETHVFCMSFGGTCNIYDLGKINMRSPEEVQRALTPFFRSIENLEIEPYK